MGKGTQRIHGLDWLRLFGAMAVVGAHSFPDTKPWASINYVTSLAVPCFVIASIYLLATGLRGSGYTERGKCLKHRALRLLPVYLIWTALYLAARLVWGDWDYGAAGYAMAALLGGAAMHLYFIPLLMLFTVAVCLMPAQREFRMAVCVVGLIASVIAATLPAPALPIVPAEAACFPGYLIFELPFLFIGVLIADTASTPSGLRAPIMLTLAALLLLLASVGGTASLVLLQKSLFVATVVAIFLGLLAVRNQPPRLVRAVGTVSFGIYLAHPALIEWTTRTLAPSSGVGFASQAVLVFMITAIICLLAGRIPRVKALVT